MEKKVTLELAESEALALFEFLSRFDNEEVLPIDDRSEEIALWRLYGALEKQLVEPFKENYDELVAAARRELRKQMGADAR